MFGVCLDVCAKFSQQRFEVCILGPSLNHHVFAGRIFLEYVWVTGLGAGSDNLDNDDNANDTDTVLNISSNNHSNETNTTNNNTNDNHDW